MTDLPNDSETNCDGKPRLFYQRWRSGTGPLSPVSSVSWRAQAGDSNMSSEINPRV